MADVTSEIVEVSFTDGEVTVEQKSTKGKKIGCGCGCGCLLIIIVIALAIFFLFRSMLGFVTDFEDKGYARQDGQVLVVSEDTTVVGPIVYFGQVIKIEGTVDGNVAAMCQEIIVSGTINGDLDVLCQIVKITETGVVTGNIHSEGAQILQNEGTVKGEITGTFQVMEGKDK